MRKLKICENVPQAFLDWDSNWDKNDVMGAIVFNSEGTRDFKYFLEYVEKCTKLNAISPLHYYHSIETLEDEEYDYYGFDVEVYLQTLFNIFYTRVKQVCEDKKGYYFNKKGKKIRIQTTELNDIHYLPITIEGIVFNQFDDFKTAYENIEKLKQLLKG